MIADHHGWANIGRHGRSRWWVPRGPASAAAGALTIYQPVTLRGRAGWRTARLAAQLGAFRLARPGTDPPAQVRELVAPHVPKGGAIGVMRSNHPDRFVAMILDSGGRPCMVAKVALTEDSEAALWREAGAITRYGCHLPVPLAPPTVIAVEPGLLVTRALEWRVRRRPWHCPSELAWALGRLFRAGPGLERGVAHGDVTPWNMIRTASEWVLLDWEDARADAPPFFDLFHFLVQSHALLGRPGMHNILRGLGGYGWVGKAITAYASGADLDPEVAALHFCEYLRISQARLDPVDSDGHHGILARRRLLDRLAERDLTRPQRIDYRDALRGIEQARHYDQVLYRPGSYDDWLWRLERRYLADVLDRHAGAGRPRYLDFACGSGRILAALEGHCQDPIARTEYEPPIPLSRPIHTVT